jgi:RNA polymerase sigma factor (sigma-70 family)
MAKSRVNPFVPLKDRIQDARLGLIDAARDFDPSLGFTFEAYARKRIWGAIRDGERSNGFFGSVRGQLKAARLWGGAGPTVKTISQIRRPDDDDRFTQSVEDVLFVVPPDRRELDDRDEIEVAMKALNDRERRVIEVRFLEGASQKGAAEAAGLSEQRVSQILPKLLERLRNHSALSHYAKGA